MTIDAKLSQLWKAELPMLVIPAGMVTDLVASSQRSLFLAQNVVAEAVFCETQAGA